MNDIRLLSVLIFSQNFPQQLILLLASGEGCDPIVRLHNPTLAAPDDAVFFLHVLVASVFNLAESLRLYLGSEAQWNGKYS